MDDYISQKAREVVESYNREMDEMYRDNSQRPKLDPDCGSSSAAPTMTPAQFREIVNETVSQNISTIASQTVSQTLAQLGFLGDRAPPAQQPPVHILFD
ncbi:hypothetical protein Taro_027055 [Colocasia esculenta]|uniref:Uncharacterized protein n=1 Tax=Colocasia esculenta TaxID=4460 RepID=A0A843VGY7_COLES|nr:hypothetical protein [Colocasia esculenta]